MDKNKICPIVKDVCKGDLCMAWNSGDCLILASFKRNNSSYIIPEIMQVSKEQIFKDEEKAQQILPECLEWARSKKITRPTRGEIRTFLTIKGAALCEAAMRSLWRQVKAELRESKREMVRIASQKWRENKSNIGLAWSSDEDEALLKGFEAGKNSFDLSGIHRRTVRAVELRLEKYGKIQIAK